MRGPVDISALRSPSGGGSGGSGQYKAPTIYSKWPLKRGGYVDIMEGYDNTQSLNFIAGAQTQTLLTVPVIQGGQVLVLTHFANQLSDIAAWGHFTWSVQINGIAVPSYNNITNQLGTNNQMREIGVDIIVEHNQTLTVICSSDATTPAIYEASVSLKGIYGYTVWEAL